MKKLYSLILAISVIVGLAGCGGGGGGSSFKQTTVNITVACLTTSPATPTSGQIATYQELFSGDSIVKDTPSSVVQIYTPVGQNSRVCLESGAAHIVRK